VSVRLRGLEVVLLLARIPLRRVALWAMVICLLSSSGGRAQSPGKESSGRVLLPNGWYLSPAGQEVALGGFPLRVVAVPRSPYAIVTSNGYGQHFLAVLNIKTRTVENKAPIHEGWMGLAVSSDGSTVYASAGGEDRILTFRFRQGALTPLSSIPLPKGSFPAGLALSPDDKVLYIAANLRNTAIAVDVQTGKILFDAPVGRKPYMCALNRSMDRLYVTNWGEDSVSVLNAHSGERTGSITVEAKPNDLLFSHDGRILFAANGDHNSISVIDVSANRVVEQIDVSPLQEKLSGTIPNALALSSEGKTLYVADANNNAVAVIDVSRPDRSVIRGFIPTGWFPAGLATVRIHAKDTLIVTNAKGAQSYGIGDLLGPGVHYSTTSSFTAQLLQGTVSFIPEPSKATLLQYTLQVRANRPAAAGSGVAEPPFALGAAGPIQHVIYIIKENRTYDQVLGDMPEGKGDARYTLFGEQVSPNQHAMARQFTLIDNLYHNAEVSATGHFWTDSAYSTEYVEKLWPATYSGRGGRSTRPDYHDDDDDYPASGFLWDECARQGISYRSYGEFARVRGASPGHVIASTKTLVDHINPDYLGSDAISSFSDLQRYAVWHREFEQFVGAGSMPAFQVISLPGDHTLGTRPGVLTPQAMVAENDYALGKMLDDISHSPFWSTTAVFVIEDDPQSGPDHVDCHRTTAFVLSPFVRHAFVDHTMYSSVSILRTMELILGLPPMTEYDAAATPMWNLFQAKADLSPFVAKPAQINLEEKNTLLSYGAAESMKMPLDAADQANDQELNRILWKSIRGSDSTPPPLRMGGVVAQWLAAGGR
jgi:YVTN family beta-propeller protein